MQGVIGTAGTSILSSLPVDAGRAAVGPDGFWMPEEAEPHHRTFMQWPVNRSVHPDPVFLDVLQDAVSKIANTVAEFEPVVMLMDDIHERAARKKLGASVEIWNVPTDDLWCRDAGPVFVRNRAGALAVAHLNFNGWGNKQPHPNDGRVAARIAKRLGLPLLDSGLVGEGGGVESDGRGTLLAHESSWINENRNRGSMARIEALLLKSMGGKKMIWAPGLRHQDVTDYHIDALARFAAPATVVIQLPAKLDQGDIWSAAAFKTFEVLKSAVDAHGRRLRIVVIPEPRTTRTTAPDFVASYVNYYACNGAVIAPQFGDPETDAEAAAILKSLYPTREVVTLDVDPIGETGGGVHCATQQQPATQWHPIGSGLS